METIAAEGSYKRQNKSGFLQELIKNRVLFLMALPGILFLVINNYIPMAGMVIAFKNVNFTKGIFGSPWCGFDNFRFLFLSPDAWKITRNTLGYNLVFILLGLIIPVFCAIFLNELWNIRLSKIYQSLILLPNFFSYVVVSYLVLAFLGEEYGFANKAILPLFGLEPVGWYSDPKYWPFILTITNIWKTTGYSAVVYLAAISGIDPEYYEAAVIDGASKWQQITKITFPFLKPLMIILTLMALGKIFYSDFGLFFTVPLENGLLYDATRTIDVYVYQAVKSDMGLASASGFYQSVIGFVLVLASNWLIGKIEPDNKLF